ncbi:Cytochrome b-c1 complex subunit 9 [Golovinomyces cichoracearum]|uniref:Complex III subunit 9 n=1 Tax=Golovinomyces cichoracearum TaxID=62708 RepID=A0A420J1B4_9PEZI|nr:Cytochrome b-c1 complex subunit 9 [Golovinomyces cichoracearum]
MAASSNLYNLLFRRNHIFLGVIFASAFAFEMSFDRFMDKIWDKNNAGRQWKDIRHRYVQNGDEGQDE